MLHMRYNDEFYIEAANGQWYITNVEEGQEARR